MKDLCRILVKVGREGVGSKSGVKFTSNMTWPFLLHQMYTEGVEMGIVDVRWEQEFV